MRRLLVILFLIPSLAFGAYTEFYCDAASGSNLNSGSNAGAVKYTSTNGNWNGTSTFTPSDTQAASLIAVGDFASVYNDGATTGVYTARVTTINSTGGNITSIVLSTTAKAGTAPTSSATGRSIKVGGAWKGPNANDLVPFSYSTLHNAVNSSSDPVRVNLKNNSTYTVSTGVSGGNLIGGTVQGYSSSVGDGGRATIDGSTNNIIVWTANGSGTIYTDLIFKTSQTTSVQAVVSCNAAGVCFFRCVFRGGRGSGLSLSNTTGKVIECEAFGNNTANSSTVGQNCGFYYGGANNMVFIRCYSHDNTGSNTNGFYSNAGNPVQYYDCISDSNGKNGFEFNINGAADQPTFSGCDAYNNGGDGITFSRTSGSSFGVWIENCNLIKNTGKGINNALTSAQLQGFVFNCGYGAGTQANGGGDATLGSLVESGKVTYPSNVTPWNAPSTGDFSLVSTNTHAGFNAGRGAFTETDGTNTGTVGYPDIGAAQHNDTCGGTGPCQTSSASSY